MTESFNFDDDDPRCYAVDLLADRSLAIMVFYECMMTAKNTSRKFGCHRGGGSVFHVSGDAYMCHYITSGIRTISRAVSPLLFPSTQYLGMHTFPDCLLDVMFVFLSPLYLHSALLNNISLMNYFSDYNALTAVMKEISLKIVNNGGIVRSIQNHGIRQLPHRFKAKYADLEGNRYYERGRFVSVFYDASPNVMRQVKGILDLNEEILRNTHLKATNKFNDVNNMRENKNPYIEEILRELEEDKQT